MPVGCRIRGPSRNDIPVSLVNLSHKAIPATRDRHDVAVRTRRFAEDLPQFPDRLRQVVLLDNRIGPNRLHKPLLIMTLPWCSTMYRSVSNTLGVSGTGVPSSRRKRRFTGSSWKASNS